MKYKKLLACCLAVSLSLFCNVLSAAPLENVHYKIEVSKTDKPVVEFFSYSCHHCYKFESLLSEWETKNNISVEKIPIDFKRKDGDHFARIFYALKSMGINADEAVFYLIHEKRERKLSLQILSEYLEFDEEKQEKLKALYNSAEVNNKLETGRELVQHYEITGVPALVVKGKYMSDAAMSRGLNGLLGIADFFLTAEIP